MIKRNNKKENKSRMPFDHEEGQLVLVTKRGPNNKLMKNKEGPFKITEVFPNGTIKIKRTHHQMASGRKTRSSTCETINIRR